MKINGYFKIRLKKALKLYPAIISVTLLLIVCIALASAVILKYNSGEDKTQKLKVGIVGDLSNTYLGIGITAIQNLDTSRFTIEFVTLEEDDAKKDLSNGNLSGYIRIPDGFVDAVMTMDNIPISYVTNNSPTGFGSILMDEVARSISDMVTESQKGIYGMQEMSDEHEKYDTYWENTDKLNIEYIDQVLKRTEIYEIRYMGASEGVSMGGYFVGGGIMIFLLLWGISCNSLLLKKDRSLESILISRGQKLIPQVLSDYMSFFTVTLVTFLIFSAIAGGILQFVKVGIIELDRSYFFDYILYVIKIIPVLLMVSSLQFLFYEAINGTVAVVLTQFLFAIGTGYICGCLYPSYFFPVSVQKIASLLPTGVGVSYMRQCLSESLSLDVFIGVLAYFILFISLAIVSRKYGLESER